MNGEFLSIETAQKIVRLEKENKQYEKIICVFDKEVNRLFNIVKEASNYIDETLLTENGSILNLKNILNKMKEVEDAKTTSQ